MPTPFSLLSFFETSSIIQETTTTITMSSNAIIPNLQDLLRRQEPYVSGGGGSSKSVVASFFASTAGSSPNSFTNPTPPTTPTSIAFNVLKPKRKKPDPITTTGIIPPCTECGKRFSSWKALFGHMRCHPERQWRGINPPPHFRLGRGGGSPLLAAGAQFSSEEYAVASSLVLLANGPSPRDGRRQKGRWEEVGLAFGMGCEHGGRHTCGVCLRGFSSGQALGGHMRCHWDRVEDSVFAGSTSNSGDFGLDLNLPPPVESSSNIVNDNANDASGLDLRLAM